MMCQSCTFKHRPCICAVSESRVGLLNKVSEFTSGNVLGSSVTLAKEDNLREREGREKTKLVQKAAFPSLPSPYGFPLWTLFSLSLSYPSLCRLLTAPQNPSVLLSGLFCLWEERDFFGAVSESR